jgi:hypothetical protein
MAFPSRPAGFTFSRTQTFMIDSTPNDRGARVGSVARRRIAVAAAAGVLALATAPAHASFLAGDTLDAAADFLAWVVLVVAPLIGISLFWMVHVLPEKLAHKRHHPQLHAIKTLCLLSLVFGGLLWPIAWLWAYTRPVGYRMAYGTEKGEEYFVEMGQRAQKGELDEGELQSLLDEIDGIAARGALPAELRAARTQADGALRARSARQGTPSTVGSA